MDSENNTQTHTAECSGKAIQSAPGVTLRESGPGVNKDARGKVCADEEGQSPSRLSPPLPVPAGSQLQRRLGRLGRLGISHCSAHRKEKGGRRGAGPAPRGKALASGGGAAPPSVEILSQF